MDRKIAYRSAQLRHLPNGEVWAQVHSLNHQLAGFTENDIICHSINAAGTSSLWCSLIHQLPFRPVHYWIFHRKDSPSMLRNLPTKIVAQSTAQTCHQHQTKARKSVPGSLTQGSDSLVVHQLSNPLLVRPQTLQAVLLKAPHAVREQPHRMQQARYQQRFEGLRRCRQVLLRHPHKAGRQCSSPSACTIAGAHTRVFRADPRYTC